MAGESGIRLVTHENRFLANAKFADALKLAIIPVRINDDVIGGKGNLRHTHVTAGLSDEKGKVRQIRAHQLMVSGYARFFTRTVEPEFHRRGCEVAIAVAQ